MSDPFAPPAEPVVTVPPRAAAWGTRFAARLLDLGAFALLQVPQVAYDMLRWTTDDPALHEYEWVVWAGVAATGLWLFAQWTWIGLSGQTLGKWLVRIRIVRRDGQPAGLLHGVVLRVFVLWFALLVLTVLALACTGTWVAPLAFWLMAMLPLYGRPPSVLHDLVARTTVVPIIR